MFVGNLDGETDRYWPIQRKVPASVGGTASVRTNSFFSELCLVISDYGRPSAAEILSLGIYGVGAMCRDSI